MEQLKIFFNITRAQAIAAIPFGRMVQTFVVVALTSISVAAIMTISTTTMLITALEVDQIATSTNVLSVDDSLLSLSSIKISWDDDVCHPHKRVRPSGPVSLKTSVWGI